MDAMKAAVALLALLLIMSLLGVLYLSGANSQLASELAALNQSSSQQLSRAQASYSLLSTKYDKSQQDLATASASLSQANDQLDFKVRQLAEAERQINESRSDLAAQQQKEKEIAAGLAALEADINESIAWFRENAYMPKNYSWAGDIFMKRVPEDCVDKGNLNLACISHLMENTAFAIHYRTGGLPGNANHFKGVKGTIDSGWGDCKDYSLLFKAILNSVRDLGGNLTAVAWQPAESGEFRVYPKDTPGSNEPYWVYSNAKAAPMGQLSHAYVVCYTVDPTIGHCTVALSGVEINESSQVPLLQGAEVFEPQSGRYLGKVGSALPLCIDYGCRQEPDRIWFVISDSDIYIYQQGGWAGYADYLVRVQQEKAALQ